MVVKSYEVLLTQIFNLKRRSDLGCMTNYLSNILSSALSTRAHKDETDKKENVKLEKRERGICRKIVCSSEQWLVLCE